MTVERMAYSLRELAEALGICEKTVRNWRIAGIGPPCFRPGGKDWLYPVEGVQQWLREGSGMVEMSAIADKIEDNDHHRICSKPEENANQECTFVHSTVAYNDRTQALLGSLNGHNRS